MLPKNERLTSVEFKNLFSTGKKIHTPSFFVVYDPKNRDTPAKFAATASKKNFKKAVLRNKIRRQVYAHIRTDTGVLSGQYIVVVKQEPIDLELLTKTLTGLL